jgi:hypothetical protein
MMDHTALKISTDSLISNFTNMTAMKNSLDMSLEIWTLLATRSLTLTQHTTARKCLELSYSLSGTFHAPAKQNFTRLSNDII